MNNITIHDENNNVLLDNCEFEDCFVESSFSEIMQFRHFVSSYIRLIASPSHELNTYLNLRFSDLKKRFFRD